MEQDFCIRKLSEVPESGVICADWLYREWGHRRPGATPESAVERFLTRAQSDRLPMAFVGFVGGQAVATSSLLATEEPSDRDGPWLGSVYVLPDMRGVGLARRMVLRVETEARGLGFEHLWLSAAVPDMYRRLGYVETGQSRHGEPVMVKRLG